jgi:hypothetical protein
MASARQSSHSNRMAHSLENNSGEGRNMAHVDRAAGRVARAVRTPDRS